MKSSVTVKVDRSKTLEASLKLLASQEVLVGIPSDKGQRKAEPGEDAAMSNAEIGYIQETGSPARNIPARPFLIPGIRKVREAIVAQLRAAGKAALDGNERGVMTALTKAGLLGQNSVRNTFVDNDWPALAESTLDKRTPATRGENGKILRRGKSRRERGTINPLILSGQLRKAISFIVRKRKG